MMKAGTKSKQKNAFKSSVVELDGVYKSYGEAWTSQMM